MNIVQFLLLKLSEECKEVGQMCDKSMQFGLLEKHPDLEKNNKQRLHDELNDLFASIEMLNRIADLDFKLDPIKIEEKKHKVKKYLEYSIGLGCVDLNIKNNPDVCALNGFVDKDLSDLLRYKFAPEKVKPCTYFSYDFDGEGITFHDSLEKAKKDTEANLDHYRDRVASGYHVDNDGNFNDVCYGVVLGRAAYNVEAKVTLEHHKKGEYKDYAVGTEILSLFIKDE